MSEMAQPSIAIIGAGPAGIRAAETVVKARLRPVVFDEARYAGGQIYRRPPDALRRSPRALYGFEARKAQRLHATFDRLVDEQAIDHRFQTVVWGCAGKNLLVAGPRANEVVPFDAVILATGAMDRIVPVPGWTLPGVYSLGGAQVMLKHQGRAIGCRPIFVGSGPLLYLAAWQYAKAGVPPAAILDSGTLAEKFAAMPSLLACPGTLLKGIWFLASLRKAGVPIHNGAIVEAIKVSAANTLAVHYLHGSKRTVITGDAVAIGYGLQPEHQLAGLFGCAMRFSTRSKRWLIEADDYGRTSVSGVYAAGDGVAIRGAAAAEVAGELAGMAALEDLGFPQNAQRRAILHRHMKRFERFRRGIELAFPVGSAATAPNDTIICRCEVIRAGELRDAISPWGISDTNRLKAITRCGMGRCQGRLCSNAAIEILADCTGCKPEEVSPPRGQIPVKPLTISSFRESGTV